jgi:paraquat-inducible protein B
MKSKANHFKIGLFVIGSIAVLIAGILAIGTRSLHKDVVRMETYINESVQGLNEGSALMHRGVAIGRVEKITFVPLEYPMEVNTPRFERYGRYVMVMMTVDRSKMPGLGGDPSGFQAMMAREIGNGLRLKLTYQGITGLLTLETDYVDPLRNPPLEVPWKPRSIYLPSAFSVVTSFTRAVDNVFQRMEKLDIEGLSQRMAKTLDAIEKAASEVKLAEVRQSIVALAEEWRQTNRQVQQVLEGQTPAPGSIPQAVRQFTEALFRIEQLVARHEDDVGKILVDLKAVSANLRDLSETLKNDPARILLSSQPAHSEVVQ